MKLNKRGTYKVVGIILTHGHYDHFKTLPDVLNKYQVPLFMHKNAYHKLSNPEYSYSYFLVMKMVLRLMKKRSHLLKIMIL